MSPAYDKRQLLKSAYNYAQSGQWDRALDEYRRISKLFPDDANVYSMIADILVKKGDPVGAMASHLEAARQFKLLGNDDKELGSLRKALRVQAGNSEAVSRMESFFTKVLAKANQAVADGQLKEAEEMATKLLDADPGHLQVNRLLDDIRGKKLQQEAVQAFQEEERMAASQAPAVDATKEVMDRLRETADKYLAAEDFDNAVETLLIMVKIDPGRHDIREQLDRAQEQLKKKQQAQSVWQSILAKDSQRIDDVKDNEVSAKEMAEWAQQEQAVRERLATELEAAEEAARKEMEIIDKAVSEIRGHKGGGSKAEGSPASVSAADESRLRALELEKRQLEDRLQREREETLDREKQIQDQQRRESELLRHAIEMERLEMEAKAKAAALKEIETKMEAERREQQELLAEERKRSALAEENLRKQMQDLMREEMAKLRDEMQNQALEDVKKKLEDEKARREQMERELGGRESAVVARFKEEQRLVETERQLAEEKARKERGAIQALKGQEDARKAAAVEEALKRRNQRVGGASQEEKQAVLKASRRISDALHAAATKHLEADVDGMLETARRYLQQDLLLDAMRLCQKIAAADPMNEKVKSLLKEIYVKKGL